MQQRVPNSDEFSSQTGCLNRKICWKSALCSRIIFASAGQNRPKSHSPWHFDVRNILKSAWKVQMPALGVCFPECCPHVSRTYITIGLLTNDWSDFTKTKSIKCFVNLIQLRTLKCSKNTHPYLDEFCTELAQEPPRTRNLVSWNRKLGWV